MHTSRFRCGLYISAPFFLFVFLLLIAPASVLPYPADAVYIPARDYFSTLTTEINNARTSVFAIVYLFALYPDRSQAQTTQLVGALIAAKKRGVTVRVVLDKGDSPSADGQDDVNANNRMAYQYLKPQGIDVCFADVRAVMHAKTVVIDSAVVIIGSANWSEAAFQKNAEASALIRSKEVAVAALDELGKIPTTTLQDQDTTGARLPVQFLKDTTLLGRMVSARDEQIFDVYLYLLRLGFSAPDSTFAMDYQPLIRYLGLDSLPLKRSRTFINRDLEILQDRFKLIQRTTHVNKDADIRLAALPGEYLAVPSGYFAWAWNKQLDLPGKVMEMLNLYYSFTSYTRPKWSLTVRTIAKWHGVNPEFVWMGTAELQRKNLIDVEYFEAPFDNPVQRHPNVYMPLPLYDPAALAAKWAGLEKKYGKEKTDRARGYAGLVYKDCDPVAVEKLIAMENKYGMDKIESASKIIASYEANNPKRCLEYFLGIVTRQQQ
jgi:hypothetical protein